MKKYLFLLALSFNANSDVISSDQHGFEINIERTVTVDQKTAYEQGALMSTLSGSGSTFFSMVYDEDARKLNELFSKQYPDYRVKTLDFDNHGIITER